MSKMKEDSPWLTNTGKAPYAVGTLVDVIYRNGETNYGVSLGTITSDKHHTSGSISTLASHWGFACVPFDWDIISYRLHKSGTPELDPEAPTCRGSEEQVTFNTAVVGCSASILDTLKVKPSATIGEEENVVNVNTEASTGVNALGGKKFDHGKPRWSLLPWNAVKVIVDVLTFGAAKYDDDNWQKVDPKKYKDALLRHITAYLGGEKVDPESGIHHLGHAGCNILFLLWFELGGDKVNES
jgi:hypothetical protein